jgi:segregation and condensation protein A
VYVQVTLPRMSFAQPVPPSSLAEYQLRLPTFEGPLDVLLRLIERSQLTITDVSLALVTDQFLTHVRELRSAPPDVVAEFVAMGTRLTVLKSRALLPRPPVVEEEPEPGDLACQLIRYRQLQTAAQGLRAKHVAGESSFAVDQRPTRGPLEASSVRLAHYEATALCRSLRRRLASVPRPREVLSQRRIVSLREMIDRLLSFPRQGAPLPFSRVFAQCESRAERAVAFLALLVLVRRGSIEASQHVRFGEIHLQHASTGEVLDQA